MHCTLISVALLFNFAGGALGATECAAGRTHKKDLANLFCGTAAVSAASCDAECCEDDKKTCAGVGGSCPFDMYPSGPPGKATTEKTAVADCCLPKVTCSNTFFTCPPGYKLGTGNEKRKCAGDAASCAVITGQATVDCCVVDPLTCHGAPGANAWTCATGMYSSNSDDGWKKSKPAKAAAAVTEAEWKAGCCAAKTTCSQITCPAGYKVHSTAGNANSVPAAATNVFTTAEITGTCCEKNAGVCGGNTVTCTSGYYPGTDTWKNVNCNGDCNTHCCTAKATCAAASCPAGYKMKKDVAKTSCTGDHTSCLPPATECCEKNVQTCGGLSGITCGYGTFDASSTFTGKTPQKVVDAWKNTLANETNKNTNCCSPAAACSSQIGTTTPAPAVTTTPAAPARLYSQHKTAVGQEKPWSANMAWLGVGCLVGMTVLMAVRGVRSRQILSAEAEE